MYVKCDTVKKLQPVQLYVDSEMELRGAEEVISVQAKARVDSVTPSAGAADVAVSLDHAAIYLNEDGMTSAKDVSVRQVKLTAPFLSESSRVICSAGVVSTEFVGTKKLRIRVMLEVSGVAIDTIGFENADAAENLCVKRESVGVISAGPINGEFIAEGSETAREAVDEIVFTESRVKFNNVSSATDITRISGILYTYVRYISGGKLSGAVLRIPFDEELLTPGVTEASKVFPVPVQINESVVASEEDGKTELKAEAAVVVGGYYVNCDRAEVISDAYSKNKEIETEYARAEVTDGVCSVSEKIKFFGTAETDGAVMSIVSLGAPAICALGVTGGDPLVIEGVVGAEVISEDGDGRAVRNFVEVPFRTETSLDTACPYNVSVTASVEDYSARLRQGGSLEISGEIEAVVYSETVREVRYLASAKETRDKTPDDELVISLYVAGEGESLFDVAKALNSDEDELRAMNPALEEPLEAGARILFYRM